MMRWVVGASLRARRLVFALAVALMVVGFVRLRDMPVDVLPEFAPPTVEVQTEALGLSAEEVEQLITVPLEQDLLNGVAFLEEIRSASVPGLSSIQMIFEPGTDLLDARQVVQERVSQAQVALPGVQSRPTQMLQPLSSTSRVLMVGLSSESLSTIDMSILGRWTIGPKLLGVPGVANVAMFGSRDKQLQVLVDPARLRRNGVSLQQVIETTANAQYVCPLTFVECSTPGTGGLIETGSQRIGVQHVPVTATPRDLARVPIDGAEDRHLALGDVTDVVEDHQPLIGDAVGPDLLLVVEKFPSANTLEVTRGIEDALDELRPGLSGIRIDTSLYRPATFIETSRSDLATALLIGFALALLAIGAFLFEWRAALVSVVAMACSVAAAVAVLSVTDATLNAMTIAGLVLALVVVVDDAIIDVENAARRRPPGHLADANASAPAAIVEATMEMRSAAAFAVVIVLASVVPVFFAQGSFGAFFPSIAFPYALAVLASMAVAVLVTPALGLLLLPTSPREPRPSPIVRRLEPRYLRALGPFTRSARPGLAAGAVLLVVGIVVVPFLTRSTVPSFQDTNVLVHLTGAPGTSLTEMQRVAALMARDIRAIPGVRDAGAHVGRAVLSDQVIGADAGQLWVNVDPEADVDATRAAIERAVGGYPGVRTEVTNYPTERIGELLPSTEPVTVRIFGEDLDLLRDKGDEVRGLLSGIDGVVDPHLDLPPLEPSLAIEVDLDAAAEHGIRPGDVRRAAATLLSGTVVGSLFEEQKVFEVVVWGSPEVRGDLTSIDDLVIDTPVGGHVRLGDVADVRIEPSPTVFRHESVSRYVDVTAGVDGRDLGSVLADVRTRLATVTFPLEYHAEVLGDTLERDAADRRALELAVAAAIIVVLLLQAGLGSWRLAALAFGAAVLALAGGAIAALLAGGIVSLGSIAGFLGVLAISTRQSLVWIRHVRHLELAWGEPFGPELVERTARERLAPLATSAVATLVLFAPPVVMGGVAGLEIVHPMAVVIVGGLVVSTFVTSFVLPGLVLRFATAARRGEDVSLERLAEARRPEGELIGGAG